MMQKAGANGRRRSVYLPVLLLLVVSGGDVRALGLMLEEGTIDAYVPVYTLATNEYYFAFSPDTPAPIVTAFQQAIDEMKNESGEGGTSVYQEILSRHTGQNAPRGL
jgi:hypothetical protein